MLDRTADDKEEIATLLHTGLPRVGSTNVINSKKSHILHDGMRIANTIAPLLNLRIA